MIVKLLTEHHLEFLSFKGGGRGSSESTHVKMPHCSKSHALAHMTKRPEQTVQIQISGVWIFNVCYSNRHFVNVKS